LRDSEEDKTKSTRLNTTIKQRKTTANQSLQPVREQGGVLIRYNTHNHTETTPNSVVWRTVARNALT